MSFLRRVVASALVSLVCVGVVAAQTPYNLCYKILGQAAETLDDPYSLSVEVSGTYNPALLTSTAGKYTPAGQYYVLQTATGIRTINTRNGGTYTTTITSLAPAGTDFSDNRFYISNASFPQFIDGDGLTFNLATTALFPGKTYSSFWNVYRQGVYGPVLEDKTSGEDLTQFFVSSDITGWGGEPYDGTCDPITPLENPASDSHSLSPNTVYTVELFYNISSTASEPAWNVVVDATFTTDGTLYGPDELGDNWLVLSTAVPASGTRTYCIVGATPQCSTVNIVAAAATGAYGFSDNRIYTYRPWLSYNGPAYTLASPQSKPGYTTGNTVTLVNPYVSKGGQFYEGFGSGGTGPNGLANNALTFFSVTISP